jgi:hypothetical protein
VPIKKARSLGKKRTMPQASRRSNSFRHFVRNLNGGDSMLASFKAHAAANDFPDTESWAKIRSYLLRTGAEHETVVGARIAWRQFQSR